MIYTAKPHKSMLACGDLDANFQIAYSHYKKLILKHIQTVDINIWTRILDGQWRHKITISGNRLPVYIHIWQIRDVTNRQLYRPTPFQAVESYFQTAYTNVLILLWCIIVKHFVPFLRWQMLNWRLFPVNRGPFLSIL